jgi:O-acetylhomoserine (thiol)-lyase
MLNEPDPSYHGVVYTEALGAAAYIARCRVVPLRMARHCSNAQAVAEYLEQHPAVTWVNYAGLPTSRYHQTCQKILGGKASGILTFGIKGGAEAGARFIDALQMVLRLVNIGDAVIPPFLTGVKSRG